MSNAFYHYKQRCDELERALAEMTAERDHYFTSAEHYRCNTQSEARKESAAHEPILDWDAIFAENPDLWAPKKSADPLLAQLEKALDGLNEVTLDEAIAAMGLHEPDRSLMVRTMACMRKMGWQKHERRGTSSRFIFRRTGNAPQIAEDAKDTSITTAIQAAWDRHSQRAPYQWPNGCGGFVCLQSPPLMAETAFVYAVRELLSTIGTREATHNALAQGREPQAKRPTGAEGYATHATERTKT